MRLRSVPGDPKGKLPIDRATQGNQLPFGLGYISGGREMRQKKDG